MMKEYVENGFEKSVELRTEVAAPHFEDRSAFLTAQPVVPLKEIHTKARLRKLWFLGGAFAVAIILGAASALVAVQLKRIAAGNQTTQTEEPAPQTATAEAQTLPVQTESIPDATVPEEEVQPPASTVTTPTRQAPVARRPRAGDSDRETLGRGRGVQPSEEEELEQIRDAVLYERWQERRARRAERRERNRGDRDLSQVDEIFEGRRRPERP